MRIDPQIARLRCDPAPVLAGTKAADAVLVRWRAESAVRAALDDLARHGAGALLADCPALARLMGASMMGAGDGASLSHPVPDLLRALCETLARHPLAQPGLVASQANGSTRLVLAGAGRSSLSLVLTEPGCGAGERSAVFSAGEVHLRVLAGTAQARFISRSAAGLTVSARALVPGDACTLRLDRETLNLAPDGAAFVSLRLNRLPQDPGVTQEIDLETGALLHQSAADPRESRIELAMALLRAMGRVDAAPVLAGIAREGSAPLRWQALRECLALDTATGFAALLETVRDGVGDLAGPARALADNLAARHPALARMMEDALCPA